MLVSLAVLIGSGTLICAIQAGGSSGGCTHGQNGALKPELRRTPNIRAVLSAARDTVAEWQDL